MKKLIFILLIVIISSCDRNETSSILSKSEWNSIANNSIITDGTKHLLYYKYSNSDLKEIIYKLYNNCTYLGYETNDSIAQYILNRKDKAISQKLNEIFKMDYKYDTTELKKSVLYFTEPFYVNENIICFSVTNKESGKVKWSSVYFLKNKDGSFVIIMVYDIKNDKFYKVKYLPR